MSSETEHDRIIFRQLHNRRLAIQKNDDLSSGAKQRLWSRELRQIQSFMLDNQKLSASPLTPPPETGIEDGMLATNMMRIPSRKRSLLACSNRSQLMQRSVTQAPDNYRPVNTAPLRRFASISHDLPSSLSTSTILSEPAYDLSFCQQNNSSAINVRDNNAYTTYDPADFINTPIDIAYGCAMKRQCTNASDIRSTSSHALTSASNDESFVSSSATSNSSVLDSQTSYAHSASDGSHFWQQMSRNPSTCTSVDVDTAHYLNHKSNTSFSSSYDHDNGSIFPSSFNAQLYKQNEDDLLFSTVSDDLAAQHAMIDTSKVLALGTNLGLFDTGNERDLLTDLTLDGNYNFEHLQLPDMPNDLDLDCSGTSSFSPSTLSSLDESAVSMERSQSQQSSITINTMSSEESDPTYKAASRRRKHIENSKQIIAPRSSNGPASVPMTRMTSSSQSTDSRSTKQAITRAPYRRPKVEKSFCKFCDRHPEGFHGIHELRRHVERLHSEVRKVWMCVEPKTPPTEPLPQLPLSSCKHCLQGKKYGVYYNAAAHIRRAHFMPRKRGRRPRGAEKESRAGKAGGDWPSIEWLKINGYLQEVTINARESSALIKEEKDQTVSQNLQNIDSDENDIKQQVHELESGKHDVEQQIGQPRSDSCDAQQQIDGLQLTNHDAEQRISTGMTIFPDIVVQPQQQMMSSRILGLDAGALPLTYGMDDIDLSLPRAHEAPASSSCTEVTAMQSHASCSLNELEERLGNSDLYPTIGM